MTTTKTAQSSRQRSLRAPGGWVIYPASQESETGVDWSRWYLTDEEDMGESGQQSLIIWVLRSVLTVLAKERGWRDVFIGADQFFAWVEAEPLVRVSPDVYLLDEPPPGPLPSQWTTWLPEHRPPRLALEVVSPSDWKKDYDTNPAKYAQLGSRELVIFDPQAANQQLRNERRVPLQLFRRAVDGAFIQVYRGAGPVRSHELAAWLVIVPRSEAPTLRVARDAAGTDLVPTESEQLADKDEQLADKDEQLADKDEQLAEQGEQLAEQGEQLAEQGEQLAEQGRALQAALAQLEQLRRLREKPGDSE